MTQSGTGHWLGGLAQGTMPQDMSGDKRPGKLGENIGENATENVWEGEFKISHAGLQVSTFGG